MRKHGLQARSKRKFRHTTDSRHNLPIADNLLDRQFMPKAKNQAWVSDITYIRTGSGWLYLAVVLDLYSRKVVGWAMAAHLGCWCIATEAANTPVLSIDSCWPSISASPA